MKIKNVFSNLEFFKNNDFIAIFTMCWTKTTSIHMVIQKLSLNFDITIWMFTIDQNVFAIFLMVLKETKKFAKNQNDIFHILRYY